jgi:hypothetical protein
MEQQESLFPNISGKTATWVVPAILQECFLIEMPVVLITKAIKQIMAKDFFKKIISLN